MQPSVAHELQSSAALPCCVLLVVVAGASKQLSPEAWNVLFPSVQYHPEDRRAILIRELVYGFSSAAGWARLQAGLQRYGDGRFSLDISFRSLQELCPVDGDVSIALELQPVEALACISAAAHQVAFYVYPQHMGAAHSGAAANSSAGPVAVRLTDFTPSVMHIRQLNSSSIGKLSTLRGTVLRMSSVRPLVMGMDFVCGKCGEKQYCSFTDGKFTPPERCSGGGCRGKTFAPARSTATFTDWRKVRLQEVLGADKTAVGSVPRCVEVELRDGLVDSCTVGDVVTVLGHVKVLATGEDLGKGGGGGGGKPGGGRGGGGGGGGGGGSKQGLFLIYLDAISVVNGRPSNRPSHSDLNAAEGIVPGCDVAPGMPPFTQKDLEFVIKFSEDYEGDQLRQLVQSLCPSIYGHELVKAGLLLALFGGVRKNAEDEDQSGGGSRAPGAAAGDARVAIRGSIHVLVVGDPGLGKSQLLQAAAAASPRGLYVCGNTSTNSGLTVSVVRDAVTGDFVFEAGAVVLADRGVCCVDEFDKMTAEHQVLLEAMEQQSVSVAKGGMVASLPARTTILAAANPAEGHYNKAKSVCANLKMSPAMLSRFDLIFILLDKPDEALDQALSEHVMALHSGLTNRATAARQRLLEYRPGGNNSSSTTSSAGTNNHNGAVNTTNNNNNNINNNSSMAGRQGPTSARASALHPRLSHQHQQQQQQQSASQQQHNARQQPDASQHQQQSASQHQQDASQRQQQHSSHQEQQQQQQGGWDDPADPSEFGDPADPNSDPNGGGAGGLRPLRERLQLQTGDEHHPLPITLLRKYIAYAKQYCSPVISDGARDVLQSFYLKLRQQASPGSSNPITARQLESLVRLAEARARCELRQVVSERDAQDVVEIMKEALYDRFMDDVACVDFRRGGGGSSGSAARSGGKAAEAKRFLLRLQHVCEHQGRDTVSTGELHALASEIGLNVRDVSGFLEQLNEAGELLQRGGGQYKVRCAPAPRSGSQQQLQQQQQQQQSQGYAPTQTPSYSRS
ncbi:MAG: hypothetical protein WDW36_003185 [Sanguina aurantia]